MKKNISLLSQHCRLMIAKHKLPLFIHLLFLASTSQNFIRSLKANDSKTKAHKRFVSLCNNVKRELHHSCGSTITFEKMFKIVRDYLTHNHRIFSCWNDVNEVCEYKQMPWTDEEVQVWELILFYTSEIINFIPKVDDENLLSQLKSKWKSLCRKEYKETTMIESTRWKKNRQTVICRICEFHGDPKDPSKTCCCCYECGSKDADCKRCRICGQHDSTKCTCCPICNTCAEGCRKCPECNEHECSC
jgi:hypothetical protein